MDEEHEAFTFDVGVAAAAAVGDLDDPLEAPAAENGRGWELVPLGDASSYVDDDLYVFPPNLHEGLHLRNESTPMPTSALNLMEDRGPPAAESPASRSEEERAALERPRRMVDTAWSLIGTGLDFVYSRIPSRQGGGSGCCCCCTTMTVWSFAMLSGMVGVLLYMSRRHRRKKAVLLLLLQEKDQKISQLLRQVAQMNQIIAARQRISVFRRI